MRKVLYLSLSGMTEALGRSQVFEYLIDLSKKNKIYLISFEREPDAENKEIINRLAKLNNIEWHYFDYSNRYGVLSTVVQILKALILGSRLIKNNKIDIVHSRSMIPATIALILRKIHNVKHLFDIRGFVFDEKSDRGRLKKHTLLFKALKKLEKALYLNSDHIVTLTNESKNILAKDFTIDKKDITVIPTCANKDVFKVLSGVEKDDIKYQLGFNSQDKILIHTGSVTNSYDFESEVKIFKNINNIDNNIKFLIVNKGQHQYISSLFKKYDISVELYKIISSSFEEMHKYLNIADASIFFIPPTYSKKASIPTKFAENLLCHLPSITNEGVGDMKYYMTDYNVGLIFDLLSIEENSKTIENSIIDTLYKKVDYDFEKLYYQYFDKTIAVNKYQQIYKELL